MDIRIRQWIIRVVVDAVDDARHRKVLRPEIAVQTRSRLCRQFRFAAVIFRMDCRHGIGIDNAGLQVIDAPFIGYIAHGKEILRQAEDIAQD